MAIEGNFSTINQRINFGTALGVIPQKTILLWINLNDVTNPQSLCGKWVGPTSGWTPFVMSSDVGFTYKWSTTPGQNVLWTTTSFPIASTGVNYQIVITYDHSSTSNNALIYVNGSNVVATRFQTPSGSPLDLAGDDFSIGAVYSTDKFPNGKIYPV